MAKKKKNLPVDPYGTIPMDLDVTFESGSSVERQRRSAKSIGQADCPECSLYARRVLPQGGHAVWETHSYPTWGNARIHCRASGIPICMAPPRNVDAGLRCLCADT